jgi:hypothetical protein
MYLLGCVDVLLWNSLLLVVVVGCELWWYTVCVGVYVPWGVWWGEVGCISSALLWSASILVSWLIRWVWCGYIVLLSVAAILLPHKIDDLVDFAFNLVWLEVELEVVW